MSTALRLHYTYREYLDALAVSELKLEFLDGEIFAMAAGSPEHGLLAASVIRLIGDALGTRCKVLTSDVKTRIPATGLSTFPDVSVVCGSIERASDDANAVINPALIVEVLSPSSADYDRGEKLRHYQHLESLRAVLFVAHDERRFTVVTRKASNEWDSRDHHDRISIAELGLELAVSEVYAPLG